MGRLLHRENAQRRGGMRLLGMTFSTILLPAALLLVILTVATRDIDKDSNADHLWRLWSQQHAGQQQSPLSQRPRVGGLDATLSGVLHSRAMSKPPLFLFIGILSGKGFRRRAAVREAWAAKAQLPSISAVRFTLSQDETTPSVQKEIRDADDIVVMQEATSYQTILLKTFFLFQHAVSQYDVRFIMKTDDDAFVNVPWLIFSLWSRCTSGGCLRERLYMGRVATGSRVLLRPGHRWANTDFFNHTGLRSYPRYALGGGYILSGDVAAMLVSMQARVGLKFSPIEDASMGAWLMAMDLRVIDQRRFWTFGRPCCTKLAACTRKGSNCTAPTLELTPRMEKWVCSRDPWLVLHKLNSAAKMRYVAEQFAACPEQPPPVLWHVDRASPQQDAAAGEGTL